jgi:hypothetical protein
MREGARSGIEACHHLTGRGCHLQFLEEIALWAEALWSGREGDDLVTQARTGITAHESRHRHLPLPAVRSPVRVSDDFWSDHGFGLCIRGTAAIVPGL